MLKDIDHKHEIIKNFTPSWFASVMGTGILAMDSLFFSTYLPVLKGVASAIFYFNVMLFFVLLIPWCLRWCFFKENAIKDMENPVISNFYATIAIAMLVLAANFIVIGKNVFIGQIFWFVGAFLTMFLGSSRRISPLRESTLSLII